IGIQYSEATADAAFNAKITNCRGIKAGSLLVDTEYEVEDPAHNTATVVPYKTAAYAETTQAEDGVTLGGIVVKSNTAKATVGSTGEASVSGTGSLDIKGAVRIAANGRVLAVAGVNTGTTIAAVNVAVNLTESKLTAVQNAFLKMTGTESMVSGSITVLSQFRDETAEDDAGAVSTAVTGGTADNNADVEIFGVKVNEAKASTQTSGTAYIEGGTYKNVGGSVTVKADTSSKADAQAKTPLTISIATIGSLKTYSFTKDSVSAYIKNAKMTVEHEVNVKANGKTFSTAFSESGGNVGVASGAISTADATIGVIEANITPDTLNDMSELDVLDPDEPYKLISPQYVAAGISGGSITAKENVSVIADNKGFAKAEVQKGTIVSVIAISKTTLPTRNYYKTEAYVTNGAKITSGGDIIVRAKDRPETESIADGMSIGFAVNANKTKGDTTVYTVSNVNVTGSLDANEGIVVEADSAAKMTSYTNAAGGGFFSGDWLTVYAKLDRKATVTIGDGASLKANYGTISILNNSGADDRITARAMIDTGGVVDLGTIVTNTDIDNIAKIVIGSGVSILNRFGTVAIRSNASVGSLLVRSSADCSGLGTRPDVTNTVNNDLTSGITIGTENGAETVIEGRYVYVNARISELDEYIYAYAKGASLGAEIYAINKVKSYLNANIETEKLHVIGHDLTEIISSTQPEYVSGGNIHSYARVQLNAIGKALAKGSVYTEPTTKLHIGENFTYTGANLRVRTENMTESRVTNDRKTGGFIDRDTSREGSDFKPSGKPVMVSPTLFLGDAAAGIYIDISERNGSTLIREVGVKNEDAVDSMNENSVTLKNIANYLPGYAYLNGSIVDRNNKAVDPTVWDQTQIPHLTVTNSTDIKVVFKNVTLENKGFVNPRVFLDGKRLVTAVKQTGKSEGYPYEDAPYLLVSTSGKGGVDLQGLILLYNGTTTFEWTDEERGGGKLTGTDAVMDVASQGYVRPLWTHKLVVRGASQVGDAVEKDGELKEIPFYAWVFEGSHGSVDVIAAGDVNMVLTAVRIIEVPSNTELDQISNEGVPQLNMDIVNVVSENGNVILDLTAGRELYTKDGVSSVTIPVPGTLEYGTDNSINLKNNYTITGRDMLEYYLVSYDPVSGMSEYELPNGSYIYMDETGKVTRIEEGGSYRFNTTDNADGKPVLQSIKIDPKTTITITAERKELADYLDSYDTDTGISAYQLPNGTRFSLDADGVISNILETSTVSDVGSYTFETDGHGDVTRIGLGNGITIDLQTGTLAVAEFVSYAVLLKAVKASWLADRGLFDNSGGIVIRITKDNTTDADDPDATDAPYTLEWIGKWGVKNKESDYYKLTGTTLSYDAFKNADKYNPIFVVALNWDDTVTFYQIGGDDKYDEQDITNEDYFKNLMIEGEGKDAYIYREPDDDYKYRTRQGKYTAFMGNWKAYYKPVWLKKDKLYVSEEKEEFTTDSFLGSGYKVEIRHAYNPETKEYDIITGYYLNGTTKLNVVYTPLGYTLIGTNGIYEKLKGVYWNPKYKKDTLKTAHVEENKYITINTHKGGSTFIFTEPTYDTAKVKYHWHDLSIPAFYYRLTLSYIIPEPITASLANENFESGDKYPVTVSPTDERYIYPVYDEEKAEIWRAAQAEEVLPLLDEATLRKTMNAHRTDGETADDVAEMSVSAIREALKTRLKDAEVKALLESLRTKEDPVSAADRNLAVWLFNSRNDATERWRVALGDTTEAAVDELFADGKTASQIVSSDALTAKEILAILRAYNPGSVVIGYEYKEEDEDAPGSGSAVTVTNHYKIEHTGMFAIEKDGVWIDSDTAGTQGGAYDPLEQVEEEDDDGFKYYHYYIVSNTGSILEVSDTYYVAVKEAETEGGAPTIKLLKVTEGDQLNIEKKESAGYRLTVNGQVKDYLWTAKIVAAGETTVSRQVEQSGGGSVLTYYTGGTLFTS
ncbi:MAG: hypothetical protein K5647_09755, partial [Clostridiales bacterium]|nr:hypothetical protein [Clostridiales bacterium]